MLINLSNHPSADWQPQQLQTAIEKYYIVKDLFFPQVDPSGDEDYIVQLAEKYMRSCLDMLAESGPEENNAVHIMGELTFCLTIVVLLQKEGIVCLASTSKRFASFAPAGEKISAFSFVRFRKYPLIARPI